MSEELELVTVGKLQKFADRLSPYLGGKNVYSSEEQKVGLWIDGKPVYQKVVYISSLPNNTTTNYAHGISDISTIVGIESFVKWPSEWVASTPWVVSGDDTETITVSVGLTYIQIVTKKNRTSMSSYVILRYTKTTD